MVRIDGSALVEPFGLVEYISQHTDSVKFNNFTHVSLRSNTGAIDVLVCFILSLFSSRQPADSFCVENMYVTNAKKN